MPNAERSSQGYKHSSEGGMPAERTRAEPKARSERARVSSSSFRSSSLACKIPCKICKHFGGRPYSVHYLLTGCAVQGKRVCLLYNGEKHLLHRF